MSTGDSFLKKCLRLCDQWCLVLLEYVIGGWTYYAYVVRTRYCFNDVDRYMLLIPFTILWLMVLWSHSMAVYYPKRPVPAEFSLSEVDWDDIEHDSHNQKRLRDRLGIKTTSNVRGVSYTINYCFRCNLIKPDRCHHCRRCNQCVLRMDHHCPWLGNCVGFHNHKFFILFLHYTFFYIVFILITCAGILPHIYRKDFVPDTNSTSTISSNTHTLHNNPHIGESIEFPYHGHPAGVNAARSMSSGEGESASLLPNNTQPTPDSPTSMAANDKWVLFKNSGMSSAFFHVLGIVVVHLTILAGLLPLLHMHAYLLARNITTLEWSRPVGLPGVTPNCRVFDLGPVSANHNEIMGSDKRLWPFPVFTSLGDGVHFPITPEYSDKTRTWSAIDLL